MHHHNQQVCQTSRSEHVIKVSRSVTSSQGMHLVCRNASSSYIIIIIQYIIKGNTSISRQGLHHHYFKYRVWNVHQHIQYHHHYNTVYFATVYITVHAPLICVKLLSRFIHLSVQESMHQHKACVNRFASQYKSHFTEYNIPSYLDLCVRAFLSSASSQCVVCIVIGFSMHHH